MLDSEVDGQVLGRPPSPRLKPAVHYARVVANVLSTRGCEDPLHNPPVYADCFSSAVFANPQHSDERFKNYVDFQYGPYLKRAALGRCFPMSDCKRPFSAPGQNPWHQIDCSQLDPYTDVEFDQIENCRLVKDHINRLELFNKILDKRHKLVRSGAAAITHEQRVAPPTNFKPAPVTKTLTTSIRELGNNRQIHVPIQRPKPQQNTKNQSKINKNHGYNFVSTKNVQVSKPTHNRGVGAPAKLLGRAPQVPAKNFGQQINHNVLKRISGVKNAGTLARPVQHGTQHVATITQAQQSSRKRAQPGDLNYDSEEEWIHDKYGRRVRRNDHNEKSKSDKGNQQQSGHNSRNVGTAFAIHRKDAAVGKPQSAEHKDVPHAHQPHVPKITTPSRTKETPKHDHKIQNKNLLKTKDEPVHVPIRNSDILSVASGADVRYSSADTKAHAPPPVKATQTKVTHWNTRKKRHMPPPRPPVKKRPRSPNHERKVVKEDDPYQHQLAILVKGLNPETAEQYFDSLGIRRIEELYGENADVCNMFKSIADNKTKLHPSKGLDNLLKRGMTMCATSLYGKLPLPKSDSLHEVVLPSKLPSKSVLKEEPLGALDSYEAIPGSLQKYKQIFRDDARARRQPRPTTPEIARVMIERTTKNLKLKAMRRSTAEIGYGDGQEAEGVLATSGRELTDIVENIINDGSILTGQRGNEKKGSAPWVKTLPEARKESVALMDDHGGGEGTKGHAEGPSLSLQSVRMSGSVASPGRKSLAPVTKLTTTKNQAKVPNTNAKPAYTMEYKLVEYEEKYKDDEDPKRGSLFKLPSILVQRTKEEPLHVEITEAPQSPARASIKSELGASHGPVEEEGNKLPNIHANHHTNEHMGSHKPQPQPHRMSIKNAPDAQHFLKLPEVDSNDSRDSSGSGDHDEDLMTGHVDDPIMNSCWEYVSKMFRTPLRAPAIPLPENLIAHIEKKFPLLKWPRGTPIAIRYYPSGQPFCVVFNNGSGRVHYPHGGLAVAVSAPAPKYNRILVIRDPFDQFYYYDRAILADLLGNGYGMMWDNHGSVKMHYNPEGGFHQESKEKKIQRWQWGEGGQRIIIKLNHYMTLKIMDQDKIYLVFYGSKRGFRINIGAGNQVFLMSLSYVSANPYSTSEFVRPVSVCGGYDYIHGRYKAPHVGLSEKMQSRTMETRPSTAGSYIGMPTANSYDYCSCDCNCNLVRDECINNCASANKCCSDCR